MTSSSLSEYRRRADTLQRLSRVQVAWMIVICSFQMILFLLNVLHENSSQDRPLNIKNSVLPTSGGNLEDHVRYLVSDIESVCFKIEIYAYRATPGDYDVFHLIAHSVSSIFTYTAISEMMYWFDLLGLFLLGILMIWVGISATAYELRVMVFINDMKNEKIDDCVTKVKHITQTESYF